MRVYASCLCQTVFLFLSLPCQWDGVKSCEISFWLHFQGIVATRFYELSFWKWSSQREGLGLLLPQVFYCMGNYRVLMSQCISRTVPHYSIQDTTRGKGESVLWQFCCLGIPPFLTSQDCLWALSSVTGPIQFLQLLSAAGPAHCQVQGRGRGWALPDLSDLYYSQAKWSLCQRFSWSARLSLDHTVGVCWIHVLDSAWNSQI